MSQKFLNSVIGADERYIFTKNKVEGVAVRFAILSSKYISFVNLSDLPFRSGINKDFQKWMKTKSGTRIIAAIKKDFPDMPLLGSDGIFREIKGSIWVFDKALGYLITQ